MLKPRTAVVCCTTLAAGAFLLASCQMPLRSQTISHEFFDDLKLIKESWIGSIVSPHAPVERQFDCLKRVEDNGSMFGWLGPLMQRIGCSWVKWTEFPPPVLAEFAVKLQPGSSWPAVFHIQPLDAVEPLGALEPIEHWRDKYYRRLPPGVWIKGRGYVVNYDQGGSFDIYKERWSEIARMDDQVEVLDYCASGCTVLTMYVPKDRLCFGERASLNFHMAGYLPEKPNFEFTKWMVSQYPDDIRNWLIKMGGQLQLLPPIYGHWTLSASELWKMGYRKCSD